MSKRFISIGLLRLIGLVVVVAIVAGMAPERAGAAAMRGSTYSSEDFGYTVSYDDSIWEAEEIEDANGVRLNSDLSFGVIQAVSYEGDLADCVADSTMSFAGQDNVSDFGKASKRMDRPETARGAEGELFTYVDVEADEAEIAMYVECRELPVDGALLQVILFVYGQSYDVALGTWGDLLGEVEIDGGAPSNTRDGDKPADDDNSERGSNRGEEAGLDGDVYLAPDFGFSVAIDEDVWAVRELESDEEMGTGIEVSTEATIGYITVGEEQRTNFEDCAVHYAEGIGEYEIMSRMRDASRKYDLPKTDRDAVGALYTFTQEVSDGSVKMIGYFECRLLSDGESVARILLATQEKQYEDEFAAWENLLDGIEVDTASQSDEDANDEESRDRDDGEEVEDDERGDSNRDEEEESKDEDRELSNDEASFIGPNFGFSVSVDEAVWTIQDLSADGNDILDLQSEFAIGTVAGFGAIYDPASCLELMIGLKVGDTALSFDVAPDSMARPELAAGATGELFVYTVDTEQGPVELTMYVECRPLAGGDASLGIALVTVPEAYKVAAPEFERVLSGISTGTEA